MVKVSLIAKVVAINLIFTVFAGIVVLSSVQSRLTRFQTQLATHDHTHDETEHHWVELVVQRAVSSHESDYHGEASAKSNTRRRRSRDSSIAEVIAAESRELVSGGSDDGENEKNLTHDAEPNEKLYRLITERKFHNERVDREKPPKDSPWARAVHSLARFGIVDATKYRQERAARLAEHNTSIFRNWWSRLDNPFFFRILNTAEWSPIKGGYHGPNAYETTHPDMQFEPSFVMKHDKHYYKGYLYPEKIQCPGAPVVCGGRGVCDPDRGICVCHPPFTGWACEYNMDRPTAALSSVTEATTEMLAEHCKDQEITDERVEKWDKRTEERCAKLNGTNGMWLGMSQQQSKFIALSIASALGVKDGATVLDIGMGCGDLIGYIKAEYPGIRVAGLDYSRSAIKFVRKKFAAEKNSVFCVADVRKLEDFPSNSIDYAYENGVFSVSRDKHCKTYKDVVRMLRPGGTLLVHQTWQEHHRVKCWQNIRMQSLERCLGPTGVRFEYVLSRDLSSGVYDTYCAGETYAAIIRKPLSYPRQ